MTEPRLELKRLLALARKQRSNVNRRLWTDVQRVFSFHHEPISFVTYTKWYKGDSFPSTHLRQELLAQAVGGELGEKIRRIVPPPFRAYRKGIMMSTHRKMRLFKMVTIIDDGGKPTTQAQIICVDCGKAREHLRRGALEDEEFFRNKGWEVGKDDKHDLCPECAEKRRKVIKMADHKKPPENENKPKPITEMTKVDGRLILAAIGEHWDDNRDRYLPGWSDTKIAEKQGVPVEWVATIRERDYGGVGDDPTVHDFITEQVTLRQEMEELNKGFAEVVAASATLGHEYKSYQDKHERLLESFRDKLGKLATKVHRLDDVAGKLKPPFPKAS